MKLFRSFLKAPNKKVSMIAFLVASCVTTSTKREELSPYIHSESFYSPYRETLQSSCKETCPNDVLFKFYCRNGKQRRKLTAKFLAILGKPPLNVSVEEGAKARQNAAERMKKSIESFYLRGLAEPRDNSMMTFTGLPSNNFSDIRRGLKNLRIDKKAFAPVFIKTGGASDPILAMMGKLPQYKWAAEVGEVTRDRNYGYSECRGRVKCELFDSCEDSKVEQKCSYYVSGPLFAFVDNKKLAVRGESIYPLRRLIPFETHSFSSEYTMLIPPETQTGLFGGTIFVRKDGTFDLEQAVKDRRRLWEAYIKRFTMVAEAQDKDPDITRYEVSLNLEPFCAYGRRIDDILTK